jgi:hypothetical protein
MSVNRIAHLFDAEASKELARQPRAAAGFETLPVQSMPELVDQCHAMSSVYEMAYLFARMGYVVGE